jgi:deoxyadenosine/deoxycytidine kinase
MNDLEFKLLKKWDSILTLNEKFIYIYLQTDIATCQENIKKRGFEYESRIPDEYLKSLEDRMNDFHYSNSESYVLPNSEINDFLAHIRDSFK